MCRVATGRCTACAGWQLEAVLHVCGSDRKLCCMCRVATASCAACVGSNRKLYCMCRVATNLVKLPGGPNAGAVWSFDLDGIASMFRSYETTNLWPFLERPQVPISLLLPLVTHRDDDHGRQTKFNCRSTNLRPLFLAAVCPLRPPPATHHNHDHPNHHNHGLGHADIRTRSELSLS